MLTCWTINPRGGPWGTTVYTKETNSWMKIITQPDNTNKKMKYQQDIGEWNEDLVNTKEINSWLNSIPEETAFPRIIPSLPTSASLNKSSYNRSCNTEKKYLPDTCWNKERLSGEILNIIPIINGWVATGYHQEELI